MSELTPSRARAIATTAYLFAYPLVKRYQDMYRQAIDVSSSTYSGGFGTWRHVVAHERRKQGSGRPNEAVVYVDLGRPSIRALVVHDGWRPIGGGVHRPMG